MRKLIYSSLMLIAVGLFSCQENKSADQQKPRIFPEYNYAFECKNNTAIMFPGPVKHAVQKLLQIDYDILETDGRYSITQFLSVKI